MGTSTIRVKADILATAPVPGVLPGEVACLHAAAFRKADPIYNAADFEDEAIFRPRAEAL